MGPVTRIKTPTGRWGFPLAPERGERQPFIYEHVDGIEVSEFSERLPERIDTLLPDDELTASHKRLRDGGLFIHVTKSAEEALFITHALAGNTNHHTLIIVEPGAEARIIERFTGETGVTSHMVEIHVKENGHLFYGSLQELTKGTFLTRKEGRVARDASLDWFELDANRDDTYSRVESILAEENASTSNLSIYLAEENRVDIGLSAKHEAPRGQSKLLTKGVVAKGAKAIYEGRLHIGATAEKSDAHQEEHGLILDEEADIKASPMLFIDNNDVTCSHAATAGKPDAEKLFYLQSRGLDTEEARRLLIKGHVWDVIDAIPGRAQQDVAPLAETIIDRYAEAER